MWISLFCTKSINIVENFCAGCTKKFRLRRLFRTRTRTEIGFFICSICTNKFNKNSRFCATCPIRALAPLSGIVVVHITFTLVARSTSLLAYLSLLVYSLGVYYLSLCVLLFSLCVSSLCMFFVCVCVLCLSLCPLSLCMCVLLSLCVWVCVLLSLCASLSLCVCSLLVCVFCLSLFTQLFDLLLINSFIFVSYWLQ